MLYRCETFVIQAQHQKLFYKCLVLSMDITDFCERQLFLPQHFHCSFQNQTAWDRALNLGWQILVTFDTYLEVADQHSWSRLLICDQLSYAATPAPCSHHTFVPALLSSFTRRPSTRHLCTKRHQKTTDCSLTEYEHSLRQNYKYINPSRRQHNDWPLFPSYQLHTTMYVSVYTFWQFISRIDFAGKLCKAIWHDDWWRDWRRPSWFKHERIAVSLSSHKVSSFYRITCPRGEIIFASSANSKSDRNQA